MLIAVVLAALLLLPVVSASAEERVTLFVTSERTDSVNVFRGTVPRLTQVASIKVGREPHNLGLSVIDTQRLVEAARLKLGRQTHDVAFSPDSRSLYVGHETETFISIIDIGTWNVEPALKVGRAQHDLSISADGRELWFTVTNLPYKPGDPRVGVVDLTTGKVALLDTGANAHDVTLSPDGRVAWVTNSGFTHQPDARVDYVDVPSRRPLGSIQVGEYPFHSPKRGRDGNAVPATASEMWFSDHGLRAVVAVSLADRTPVAKVPVGTEPYHVASTAGGTLFVANHTSNSVTIIDRPNRSVLGTLSVPARPHGLAVLTQP